MTTDSRGRAFAPGGALASRIPHFFTDDAAVILYARTELAIVAARLRNLLPDSYRAAGSEAPVHTRTLEALCERLANASDAILAWETAQRKVTP